MYLNSEMFTIFGIFILSFACLLLGQGAPGPGGHNKRSNCAMEAILYFVSPLLPKIKHVYKHYLIGITVTWPVGHCFHMPI